MEGGAGLGASAALLRGVRWDYSRAGIRGIRMWLHVQQSSLFWGRGCNWEGKGRAWLEWNYVGNGCYFWDLVAAVVVVGDVAVVRLYGECGGRKGGIYLPRGVMSCLNVLIRFPSSIHLEILGCISNFH